jgi:hypothetical protein
VALTAAAWRTVIARAVQLEGEPIWGMTVESKRMDANLVVLSFVPSQIKQGAYTGLGEIRLDESLEGATIRHKPLAREGGANDIAWAGTIISVLPNAQRLSVRITEGRPPVSKDPFLIIPPSYLEGLHDWLDETKIPEDIDKVWTSRLTANTVNSRNCPPPPARLRTGQKSAYELIGAPIAIVWGPPGTGKTTTLASMAAGIAAAGHRLLVVAPTRVAADGATLAIDSALSARGLSRSPGDLLRTDLPVLAAEFEARNPDLLIWAKEDRRFQSMLPRLQRETMEVRQKLLEEEGVAQDEAIAAAASLRDTEELLRTLWRLRQKELVDRSRILVATTRQAINRSWAAHFPHLFVDEASMVSVSDGTALLIQQNSAADRSLIFFGDARQLGPIAPRERGADDDAPNAQGPQFPVITPEQARDWFETSALEYAYRNLRDAGMRWAFLDEQSRMTPAICEIVSRHSYAGKLRSAPEAPSPGLPPSFPDPIVVADPDLLPDWLTPLPTQRLPVAPSFTAGSPFSVHTARATARVARRLAQSGHSVVVCSPFRAQAAMLQRALADLPTIRAGTVHRIQGQEADATIFDPVNPTSPFLTDGQLAGRLVNVAASRTRQLLILVGTRAHLSRNAHLKPFVEAARPLR